MDVKRMSDLEKQTYVREWMGSGKSKRMYSEGIGINYKTFLGWCKRYGDYGMFTDQQESIPNEGFIPLSVSSASSSGMIELCYPNGLVLRLPQDFSVAQVKQFLS